MIEKQELEAALPALARTGLPLLVHAELAEHLYQGGDADDWRQYATYLRSRPDEAELAAIRMLIGLCRKYWFRLHIVHLSTALALEDLAQARAEGLPVTVETCPHYLHFVAEEIPAGGTLFKCAPPIRSRANREALWQGLRDGIIDLIATDHSPCPPSMKARRFPPGMGRNCQPQRGGLRHLDGDAQAWSSARGPGALDVRAAGETCRPRGAQRGHRRGVRRGPGGLRSRCRVHLDAPSDLHYRHPVSPYLGERLHGKVRATFVRGAAVFKDGSFPDPPIGREQRREEKLTQSKALVKNQA